MDLGVDGRVPVIRRTAAAVGLGLPVLFLGYFFVYPLITVLATGLGGTTAASFLGAVSSPTTRGVAWFTLWQAVVSTILTVVVGLPAAYVLGRYRFAGRRLFRAILTVPFVLPTVVVGAAFLALFGRQGATGIDLRGSVTIILIAHVFYNIAIVVRTVGTAWESLDPALAEAAATLGASPRRVAREVTLPLLVPAIVSAASIVFLFTFTSFGIILILGDISTSTLEVEIWRRATGLGDLGGAAVLAVLQLVGVTSVLWWYSRIQQRRAVVQRAGVGRLRTPQGAAERTLVTGVLLLTLAVIGAPLVLLAGRSFDVTGGSGLGNYRSLFDTATSALVVPPGEAIFNSFAFAVPAVVIAVVIGLLAATAMTRRRDRLAAAFDTVLMLPLGTSAVTLGFGMLLALDAPVDLRTSIVLVPIAHGLVGLPFVVRTTVPMLRSIGPSMREAAAVLGAAPARVWREIDLPLITRALTVGAGFALAVSLGEFGATNFLALPDRPTLPIAIFRLLGQPGTMGRAMALATVLMVLTAITVFAIERARVPGGEL
jgi:thiamine transport system permease protein